MEPPPEKESLTGPGIGAHGRHSQNHTLGLGLEFTLILGGPSWTSQKAHSLQVEEDFTLINLEFQAGWLEDLPVPWLEGDWAEEEDWQ